MEVAQYYSVYTVYTFYTVYVSSIHISLLTSEQKAGRTGVEWTGHPLDCCDFYHLHC